MFSTLSKTEILIWATFILSSASAFNLVVSEILGFGIGIKFPIESSFFEKNKQKSI